MRLTDGLWSKPEGQTSSQRPIVLINITITIGPVDKHAPFWLARVVHELVLII